MDYCVERFKDNLSNEDIDAQPTLNAIDVVILLLYFIVVLIVGIGVSEHVGTLYL